ncbi:MAG: class SAM-dependent methyltransferase [Bacteroidota bacterium]|nr:class SAM-dependent methyltransferase [Bacteroidota bacterium]
MENDKILSTPLYNNIGIGYNTTRSADPYLAKRIAAQLQPGINGTYIDVGCGTGNYTEYLHRMGFTFTGIDPSDTMLDIAKTKCPDCTFIQGYAENIPAENNSFDGAIVILTLHHWQNRQQGLKEIYRILKPGSKIVILSFTGEQMEGYWLNHYFPDMIKNSGDAIPDQNTMFDLLHSAGFSSVETEKYFVQEDLQDRFLYANKFTPEEYLNPENRKGISCFSVFSNPRELDAGLKQLEKDVASGSINNIIKSYENDKGDYLFYSAIKR